MRGGRNFFEKIPFIRITSLFLAGLFIGLYFSLNVRFIALFLLIVILSLVFLWHTTNYQLHKIQDFLIVTGILFSGIFYSSVKNEPATYSFSTRGYYLAEVCQRPIEKSKTFQTVLIIQNKTIRHEKLIAYFNKEHYDSAISVGDLLVILAKPQEIKNMGNPFEFDYKKMMQHKEIRFSVYLSKGTYLRTGEKKNRVMYQAEQVRDKLVKMLETEIKKKEERSIVSALTLGYRAEIDKDTIDYFASTGAMHVLSVSGLHVALIYFILGFFFSFIKRGKIGSLIFSCMMILFLWAYAFLTGFSPSVQRATVMFSFVIIGNNLSRPVNIYNSLTASALFLILLDPMVVYDVGFQLSYLAVFGIVLIQPGLNDIFVLKNPILKWCWSLLTVSFAAQLMTFPLSVFYFNQFPNLFWLSGFIVIPITTIIIWLTVAFFVLSPLSWVASIVGSAIQQITSWMLFALKSIDAIPLAVTDGIFISQAQVFFLYGLILTFFVFGATKNKMWLFYSLSFILLFQFSGLHQKQKLLDQNIIAVYNSKSLIIHLINGRTNYLFTDNTQKLTETDELLIKNVRSHLQLDQTQIISLKQLKDLKSDDLIIKDDRIQFLNCIIDLSEIDRTGRIIFIRYSESGIESYRQIVGVNRVTSFQKSDVFVVKKEGAFYIDLKAS